MHRFAPVLQHPMQTGNGRMPKFVHIRFSQWMQWHTHPYSFFTMDTVHRATSHALPNRSPRLSSQLGIPADTCIAKSMHRPIAHQMCPAQQLESIQLLQNLDNSSLDFSYLATPVTGFLCAKTSRRVQNMHTINDKISEMSKWKVFPFPHDSTTSGSAQKAPVYGVRKLFLVHVFFVPLGFYYGPQRLIAPTIRGREKKAVKQKMQGISIVRSRASCLVPMGELDTLVN